MPAIFHASYLLPLRTTDKVGAIVDKGKISTEELLRKRHLHRKLNGLLVPIEKLDPKKYCCRIPISIHLGMSDLNQIRELFTFCLLRGLLQSTPMHPLDRMCLQEHMLQLESAVSHLPHFNEAFALTFEDDPAETPLVKSLRAKILFEIRNSEGLLNFNLSEPDLVESFEAWIYGNAVKTPLSAKQILLLVAEGKCSKQLYADLLEVVGHWRRSQNHDANRRIDPPDLEELERACQYFSSSQE